jgi:hypothetical protein
MTQEQKARAVALVEACEIIQKYSLRSRNIDVVDALGDVKDEILASLLTKDS